MKLTILGLGEDASVIAKGLANQGLEVVAFDSAKVKNSVVALAETVEVAVADADVVFSLNSASSAIKFAQLVGPLLKPGAVYCDLNTGTPALKKRLAEIVSAEAFVDVAIMKPIQGQEPASLSVSGQGAKKLIELFDGLNLNLTYVSQVAGDAAARKQIRTMLEKGMAAVAIDTLWAAKSMGLEDWAIEEIKQEIESSSTKTLQRYLDETQQHPKRHSVEIAEVVELLSESGHESTMVRGVELTLSRVIHGVRVPFAELD